MLTLVILGQYVAAETKSTLQMMKSIVRDCGSSGRTYKSVLIFAVPDAARNVREAIRNALAWEDIDDDEKTKKWIDQSQLKLLQRNLDGARRQLKEDLFRVYRHLDLLDKNNEMRHVDLGQITSSATTPSDGIVGLYIRELRRNDAITEGVSPLKLVKYWPPALTEWSTAGVRDAFYSSPQLPRLPNPDIIKRTMICDGVTQGLLGYATKDSRGNVKLQKLKESLFDTEVELFEDVFILKADDPQKLLKPPRLARLVTRPEQATIKVGERAEFSVSAQDQYSQLFPTPAVQWSAKGGTVMAESVFTAGDTGGVYSV